MEEIDAILNDDDKVWTDVRHMHMKDALDRLIDGFRQYSSDHNSAGHVHPFLKPPHSLMSN